MMFGAAHAVLGLASDCFGLHGELLAQGEVLEGELAGPPACRSIPFTSMLAPGPLIAHDLYQLEGSEYGKAVRDYA